MSVLKAYRILVLPDCHVPLHDRRATGNVLEYAATQDFDEVIQLGDLLDVPQASRFNKNNMRALEGQRLVEDFAAGRSFLKLITDAATTKNRECKKTLLQGNHEHRLEDLIDSFPAVFEGLIELEHNLDLVKTGWKFVKCHTNQEMHKVGNMYFVHGKWCGKYPAAKHLDMMGVSVMFGHTHRVQSFSKSMLGTNNAISAYTIGHLGEVRPKWMHGPDCSSWQHAFAEVLVMNDGRYTVTIPEIKDGRFAAPDGRIYGGSTSFVTTK